MWELFSLGNEPYPCWDVHKDMSFRNNILNGYRLEMPSCCTSEIYNIMRSCWCPEPELRPVFSELEAKFAKILPESMIKVGKSDI